MTTKVVSAAGSPATCETRGVVSVKPGPKATDPTAVVKLLPEIVGKAVPLTDCCHDVAAVKLKPCSIAVTPPIS